MEEAHKLWLKERSKILDDLDYSVYCLKDVNYILRSQTLGEIENIIKESIKFIKEGEI